MRVVVKQEHISQGSRGSALYCPIAVALRDAGCKNVIVGPDCAFVDDEDYELPEEAMAFIDAFDDGGEPGPITFTMEKFN